MLVDEKSRLPVALATNPLHYVSFERQHPGLLRYLVSDRSLFHEYARELGFDMQSIKQIEAANSAEALAATAESVLAAATPVVAWKPVAVGVNQLLGNSVDLARQFEDKSLLRQKFDSLLPFAPFIILEPNQSASYKNVTKQLSSGSLVVQFSRSTGGKGTYFVEDADAFDSALRSARVQGQSTVISRRVVGQSFGVQCMIVDGKVLWPKFWHRDLVGTKNVINLSVIDATHYAGCIIQPFPSHKVYTQVKELVESTGKILLSHGYKGVFGIDLVLGDDGRVTFIEINPRITAVSHVYATLFAGLKLPADFLELHFADVLGLPVGPVDPMDFHPEIARNYYYLKVQNMKAQACTIQDKFKMGVYDKKGEYKRFGYGVDGSLDIGDMVIIPEADREVARAPGERLFSLLYAADDLVGASEFAQIITKATRVVAGDS